MNASAKAESLANTVGGASLALKEPEKQLRQLSSDLSGCARLVSTEEPLSFYGLQSIRDSLQSSVDELTDAINQYSDIFLASSSTDS